MARIRLYLWAFMEVLYTGGLLIGVQSPMILDYYPGHLKNDPGLPTLTAHHLRHIGYWTDNPDPKKSRYYQTKALLLPWPGDFVDETWDPAERDLVITYLDSAPIVEWWMGRARCRLCGDLLGAGDHSDGSYTWPKEFSHYLKEHGVRPPKEFVSHVLTRLCNKSGGYF